MATKAGTVSFLRFGVRAKAHYAVGTIRNALPAVNTTSRRPLPTPSVNQRPAPPPPSQQQSQQPRQQHQPQMRPEEQHKPHPYAANNQQPPQGNRAPPPRQQQQHAGPIPDRGTIKQVPNAEKEARGPPPPASAQAQTDPNDSQRTVHVWHSVRKVPKEMEQHHQEQLAPDPDVNGVADDPVPDVEGSAMLEGVILPAFDNVRLSASHVTEIWNTDV